MASTGSRLRMCLSALRPEPRPTPRCLSTVNRGSSPDAASTTSSSDPSPGVTEYLHEQDGLALRDAHARLKALQERTTAATDLVASLLRSAHTVSILRGVPSYTADTPHARLLRENATRSAAVRDRLRRVLDNIHDLQRIPYPAEQGATMGQLVQAELRGMSEREKQDALIGLRLEEESRRGRLTLHIHSLMEMLEPVTHIQSESEGRQESTGQATASPRTSSPEERKVKESERVGAEGMPRRVPTGLARLRPETKT